MLIQIENVTKRIKGAVVIDRVSMRMESGKVFGLRGINGSGKTMLMRLVAGLIRPTEGRILIDGKELGKDMDFPEDMGLLIENPAFLGGYSGLRNLKLLASIRETAGEDEIRSAIARVGLDPDSRKKYRKYSLGMKQRLGIAGAVSVSPGQYSSARPFSYWTSRPMRWTRRASRCSGGLCARKRRGERS